MNFRTNGQTIIEYTLVLGIVLTVMIVMQPMIKRAGQGMIKTVADQIGNQEEADQRAFYQNAISEGHLEFATIQTQGVMDTQTLEFFGLTNHTYSDRMGIDSEQQSNLGFTPDTIP